MYSQTDNLPTKYLLYKNFFFANLCHSLFLYFCHLLFGSCTEQGQANTKSPLESICGPL